MDAADAAGIIFKQAGTSIGTLTNSSNDFIITASVNNQSMKFNGEDASTGITALTVFLHIFEIQYIWWLKPVTLYSAFALALMSWIIYYRDYYNVLRNQNV